MNLEEFEIPEEVEVTLYTQICVAHKYTHNIGGVTTQTFERGRHEKDCKFILLNEKTVKIKLGKVKIDMRGEVIKGLEEQKIKVEATANMEMKEIQDKIDSLLAIEYQPSGG